MGQGKISARHRELGAELRKRRLAAGVTVRKVSEDTGWHRRKVARVEAGQYPTDPVDAILYLGACGVHRAQALDVLHVCREAEHGPGHWLTGPLATLIYHESTAGRSISYEPMVVPGLLQTPAYAHEKIARRSSSTDALRIRMERQAILHRRSPAEFVFFVHEQALRTQVGSAAVMHEQLLHMVLMAALRHVTLRIIPTEVEAQSVFGGPLRLLEYPTYWPLVYMDGFLSGVFIEDRDVVGDYYRHLLPELKAVALEAERSRKFVADMADEYDQGSAPSAKAAATASG